MTENLEKKLNVGGLDLSALAIQSAVSVLSKEGKANENIYEAAFSNYLNNNGKELSIEKAIVSEYLLKEHSSSKVTAKETGQYPVSGFLANYFKWMNQGYTLKFLESKFEDLNDALKKLGYSGTELSPKDMTIKEAIEKGDKDVVYLQSALADLAKYHLQLSSETIDLDNKIVEINKRYEKKDDKEELKEAA